MSPQKVNFGPLAAEIGPVVWGTPTNFNGFRSVTAATSLTGGQPNFARSWAATHYIYIFGSSCP